MKNLLFIVFVMGVTGLLMAQTKEDEVVKEEIKAKNFGQIKNLTQDEDIELCVNDDGTEVCSIKINGSTGIPQFNDQTNSGSTEVTAGIVKMTTTANAVDGFGPFLEFRAEDDNTVEYDAGRFGYVRAGADDTYNFKFYTENAGAQTLGYTVQADGDVQTEENLGIGVDPTEELDVNGLSRLRNGVRYNVSNYTAPGGDVNLTSNNPIYRMPTGSDTDVVGFTDGIEGRILTITKVTSSFVLYIRHNDGAATQAINTRDGKDIEIPLQGTVTFWYDDVSDLWRELSRSGIEEPYIEGQNFVTNGSFDYWQRGTSSVGGGKNEFVADRFRAHTFGPTNVTVQRNTISPDIQGLKYSLRYLENGSGNDPEDFRIYYSFDEQTTYQLANRRVVVSFYAKSLGSGNFTGIRFTARYQTDGTGIDNASTSVTGGDSGTVAINTSTWTRVEHSFTYPQLSTITDAGLVGFNINGIGTDGSTVANDGYEIAGVMIQPGTRASERFVRAGWTPGGEYRLAQRFYQRVTSGNAGFGILMSDCYANTTTELRCTYQLPVALRDDPLATLVVSGSSLNLLETDGTIDNVVTDWVTSNPTLEWPGDDQNRVLEGSSKLRINFVPGTGTMTDSKMYHLSNSGGESEVTLDSEIYP